MIDDFPLTPRYFGALAILSGALAFEMFDFVIVSFLLSALAPLWKLTFGQTAIILLAAGVGAMAGSAIAGPLTDRHGRRPLLIVGMPLCPLAAIAIGLIPEGAWIVFALLRLVLGLGYGIAGVAQFAMIVEMTPLRHRTLLASATMIPVAIGFLMAPAAMSLLYASVGWRGLALLGGIPVIFALLVAVFIPESPRWLLSRGRRQEAIGAARRLFGVAPVAGTAPRRDTPAPTTRAGRLLDHPRELAFVIVAYGCNSTAIAGVLMWGPVLVGMVLGMPPEQVAGFFVIVGVCGLVGRVAFTILPPRIGRRRAGAVHMLGAAACLTLGTVLPYPPVLGIPLFLVAMAASAFFFDGGLANLQPHAAEIFPVDVAGRGMAASQVAVGAGKILGPLILALLAGTSNVIKPDATREALVPGFLTMAALFAVAGLAFLLIGSDADRTDRPSTPNAR